MQTEIMFELAFDNLGYKFKPNFTFDKIRPRHEYLSNQSLKFINNSNLL